MQALQAEGLKKELQEAHAGAAQVQADLSAQLHSQRMLSEDVKQQCMAARHELTALQVISWECIDYIATAMLASGQPGRSNGLISAGRPSVCCCCRRCMLLISSLGVG